MAYDLVERFPPQQKYYPFYDPGTYHYEESVLKPNTVPFLSTCSRKTSPGAKLWTQATYNTSMPSYIPNITSLKSTKKRFPYEAFSTEDLEEILCKCGLKTPCVCADQESKPEVMCQGNAKHRIFKGPVPRYTTNSQQRIQVKSKAGSPPLHDIRVEATEFYRGCKWSRRTSKRSYQITDKRPGPTHYYLAKEPTKEEICMELVRAEKRKTCKQLRFIERVQMLNILEGKPGPGAYSPEMPKGTNLQFLGPKAIRFTPKQSMHPGPADYNLRRDFDPPDPPEKFCQAILPKPTCFGNKEIRFKPLKEDGPSAATYNAAYTPCHIMHCPTTPFGSSAVRFKADIIEDTTDCDMEAIQSSKSSVTCSTPTWGFRSKTVRLKPLVKKFDEPSPADLAQSKIEIEKTPKSQYIAPFNSSEGRFQPWYDYIPVHAKLETPSPCQYSSAKPRPLSAVNRGPLFRAERFPQNKLISPAPNKYNVFGGIETILNTHNNRLLGNIKKNHKFAWEPPPEPQSLTNEQEETMILQNCIALLEPESSQNNQKYSDSVKSLANNPVRDENIDQLFDKPKLLRYFLYSHPIPRYY